MVLISHGLTTENLLVRQTKITFGVVAEAYICNEVRAGQLELGEVYL